MLMKNVFVRKLFVSANYTTPCRPCPPATCAALTTINPATHVTNCSTMVSGSTCSVACKIDPTIARTYKCLYNSTLAANAWSGSLPLCPGMPQRTSHVSFTRRAVWLGALSTPFLHCLTSFCPPASTSCAALTATNSAFNVSDCGAKAAGSTCVLSCAANAATNATYTCAYSAAVNKYVWTGTAPTCSGNLVGSAPQMGVSLFVYSILCAEAAFGFQGCSSSFA